MDATTTKQNYYYNSIPLPVIKTAAPPDPSLFTSISTDMNNRKIEVFNNIFRDYTQNSAFLTNNDFQFETDFFINQMKTFELEVYFCHFSLSDNSSFHCTRAIQK